MGFTPVCVLSVALQAVLSMRNIVNIFPAGHLGVLAHLFLRLGLAILPSAVLAGFISSTGPRIAVVRLHYFILPSKNEATRITPTMLSFFSIITFTVPLTSVRTSSIVILSATFITERVTDALVAAGARLTATSVAV